MEYLNKIKAFWQGSPARLVFIIGLIIRVILMPITAHADMLLSYGRSYRLAFLGDSWFRFSQVLPHWIQAIWLKFLSIFVGAEFFQPLQESSRGLLSSDLVSNFLAGNENPNLVIFLFKLLYLLIDIAILWLLWRYFRDKKNWLTGIGFYWLNPVLIFAVYAFGRYEVIPVLLFLAIFIAVAQQKWVGSLVAMSILLLSRASTVLLLPAYLLVAKKRDWQRAAIAVLAVIPFAISLMLTPGAKQATISESNIENLTVSDQHSGYLTNVGFVLNEIDTTIYFFFLILGLIILVLWQQKIEFNTKNMAAAFSLSWVAYYATSFYHPQYLTWIILPLTILIMETDLWQKTYKLFIALGSIFIVQLLTWHGEILFGIFLPLSKDLGEKDLFGVINNYTDGYQLINLGWTAAAAVWIIIGLYIWSESDFNFKFLTQKTKNEHTSS